jgi:hypothetical protein
MRQGPGDEGATRASQTCDWSQEAERMRSADARGTAHASAAQPTPLPKVNFTLLGTGPYAAPRSSTPPPLSNLRRQDALQTQVTAASDAELDALLCQVDSNVERTLELDARPVRPPWIRRRRRKSILAGMALYLAVASASFLWFAQRSRRPAPAQASTPSEALLVAAAPREEPTGASAPGASVQSARPTAQPASAAPPSTRKAERRALANKKAKRAKLLAARAKRKKRAARAGQML